MRDQRGIVLIGILIAVNGFFLLFAFYEHVKLRENSPGDLRDRLTIWQNLLSHLSQIEVTVVKMRTMEQEALETLQDVTSLLIEEEKRHREEELRHSEQPIPILILACNRVTVARALTQLLRYRQAFHQHFPPQGRAAFPLYVSQDCGHEPTAVVIQQFLSRGDIVEHLRQPDHSDTGVPPQHMHMKGYYHLARHYRWALDQMLLQRNFTRILIVEDDLDISLDFFSYFYALAPLLEQDKQLWCISAWNDNGLPELIDSTAVDRLYRSDFFPGLGWMTRRDVWEELRSKWPIAFWDDFMRQSEVRRGRQCIRPELSRTFSFGKVGVSNGQFYDAYLGRIVLSNTTAVDFSKKDLTYLLPEKYDSWWSEQVYHKSQPITVRELSAILNPKQNMSEEVPMKSYRVEYKNNSHLVQLLTQVGAMTDLKAGVARTAYRGVVSVFLKGHRVYLAPPEQTWSGYVAT